MKLAVHQPQYLPWSGYFHKLAQCGTFVFLDNVQYKKREFQNRNKILTSTGPLWLTVPVKTKGKYTQLLNEVEIDNSENWRKDHFESLRSNYAKAPFFKEHEAFFASVYAKEWVRLVDLNVFIILYIISYLEIPVKVLFASALATEGVKTGRLISLCKKTDASVYLSGRGAKVYLEETKFQEAGIVLEYQNYEPSVYPQLVPGFVPYLSVIDLLFNKGKDSIFIIKGNKRLKNLQQ
jgi:hypothetical protein